MSTETADKMPDLVSETQQPAKKRNVHHWERGVDPWHPDAYTHTPLYRFFAQPITEARKEGWYGCTKDGAIIDFVADGTPVTPKAEVAQ